VYTEKRNEKYLKRMGQRQWYREALMIQVINGRMEILKFETVNWVKILGAVAKVYYDIEYFKCLLRFFNVG
jgi:hypothetical protein